MGQPIFEELPTPPGRSSSVSPASTAVGARTPGSAALARAWGRQRRLLEPRQVIGILEVEARHVAPSNLSKLPGQRGLFHLPSTQDGNNRVVLEAQADLCETSLSMNHRQTTLEKRTFNCSLSSMTPTKHPTNPLRT